MIPTADLDAARLAAIRAEQLAQWDIAVPYLAPALEHAGGSHTIEDLFACYLKGSVQLWVGQRCAAITEIFNHPRKRVLNVWLAGGDMREMQTLRPGMEAWARGCACDSIMFAGKMTNKSKALNGWAKASGYEPTWVNLTRKL